MQRGYHRSQEKSEFQTTLDEFYDPDIESPYVAGGDPGLAVLMASALEAAVEESRQATGSGDASYPPEAPDELADEMQRLWQQVQQGMAQ